MKLITLIPGSPEWLKSRSASKAPAMMGVSDYQTRNELLHQMATGITNEVDAATQARFSNGHHTEALARVIAEEIIADELAPLSTSDDAGYLTANFDGITFDNRIGFEHKSWNAKLAESVKNGVVPESHAWQLDQQILVGGLEYVLFVVSDGTRDKFVSTKYYSSMERAEILMDSWRQFDIDLANYTPPEITVEVVAAPIKDLPAITYKMDGMRLTTNLSADVKPAIFALVEQSQKPLETDQDFADLDALCKKFKQAEEQCALVQSQAVGEIKDVDAFCRDLKELSEIMRQARLAGEKAVVKEKDARKLAIISKAKESYTSHVAALEAEIRPILLFKGPADLPDFAGSIKGMKKISAMQEAVDTALRNAKMDADAVAKGVRAKLAWCKENAAGMSFLFPDLQQIIGMETEAFTATITNRIRTHKEAEIEREAAATARIEAQAKAKAEAAAQAELAAKEAAIRAEERAKFNSETRAKEEAEARTLHEAGNSIVVEVRARDEAQFNKIVEKGSKAWANVPNAAEWVDELRGGEVDISMDKYKYVDLFIAEHNFDDEEMMRKILIRFLNFISRED